MYSLAMAAPGSTHYGYYFISYQFVYVGNRYGKLCCFLFFLLVKHFKVLKGHLPIELQNKHDIKD